MTTRRIIGAGLPRSGTTSLTAALEILGCGPVLQSHGDNQPAYTKLLRAKNAHPDADIYELQRITGVSLADLVAPYNSMTDSPYMALCAELLELYPDSVVIVSVRDSDEQWWKSYHEIFGVFFDDNLQGLLLRILTWPVRESYKTFQMNSAWIAGWKSRYGNFAKDVHGIHTTQLQKTIPSDKLLVLNLKEGWDPLCRFLNAPIPNQPFPRVNDKEAMLKNTVRIRRKGYCIWGSVLAITAMLLYGAY